MGDPLVLLWLAIFAVDIVANIIFAQQLKRVEDQQIGLAELIVADRNFGREDGL